VTNPAAGLGAEPLSHAEVVRVGAASAEALAAIVSRALPALAGVARA
jgi:purine nucleoside phosphorylase